MLGGIVGGITAFVGYQNPLLDGTGAINWGNVALVASVNSVGGCITASAGGGSCGRGALAGAVGTVGSAYGFVGSVIAGCAAGKIGGGSCGQGALYAAGSYGIYSAVGYVARSVQVNEYRGRSARSSTNVILESGFAKQDVAAREALSIANPISISENKEYGGLIYQDGNGRYDYTGPIPGTDQGVNPFDAPIPAGTTLVGDYHTHGDYSVIDSQGRAVRTSDPSRDSFGSNNFSNVPGGNGDIQGIDAMSVGRRGYRGYLGTPSGQFKTYDPSTGKIYLLE